MKIADSMMTKTVTPNEKVTQAGSELSPLATGYFPWVVEADRICCMVPIRNRSGEHNFEAAVRICGLIKQG